MKILELLRKGFGYVLLSMGVSSRAKMPGPAPKSGPQGGSGPAPESPSARRMEQEAKRGS
jgi:hypothetical protein